MPKLILPPGWPDPYTLLRDPEWEETYPKILLRGIYSVMERRQGEELKKPSLAETRRKQLKALLHGSGKPLPGDHERRYLAGFNIIVWKLTKANHPRFFPSQIKKGILSTAVLTGPGKQREAEVLGRRDLSSKSQRKYGKTIKKTDLKLDTTKKLKKLRRLLDMVRAGTAEEGMPPIGGAP